MAELSSTRVRIAFVGAARPAPAEAGVPAPGHRFLDLAEAEGHLELLHLGTLGRREVACRPQRDRLLLARAVLAAGAALGSSMPGDARGWHDRGIALGREIGAVALVRAHQAG